MEEKGRGGEGGGGDERSALVELPGEVWACIVDLLPIGGLMRLGSTNHHLRRVALSELRAHRVSVPMIHISSRAMLNVLAFLRRMCPRLALLDLSAWDDLDDVILRRAFRPRCASSSSPSRSRSDRPRLVQSATVLHHDDHEEGGEQREDEETGEDDENGSWRHLEELHLQDTLVTDRGLTFVPSSLTSLDLTNLSDVTDRGLAMVVKRCPRLTSLKLQGAAISNAGLALLTRMTQLRIAAGNNLVWRSLGKAVRLPLPIGLEVLHITQLRAPQFPPQLLRELAKCDQLRELHVELMFSGELPVSRVWLAMKKLKSLRITNASAASVRALWFLPDGLESFTFEYCGSVHSFSHIYWPSSLKTIRVLTISLASWTELLKTEFDCQATLVNGAYSWSMYRLDCTRHTFDDDAVGRIAREEVEEWKVLRDQVAKPHDYVFWEDGMHEAPIELAAVQLPEDGDGEAWSDGDEALDEDEGCMLSIGF